MTPREIDKKLGEAVAKAQLKFFPQTIDIKINNIKKGERK